jgi:hypothetical protein
VTTIDDPSASAQSTLATRVDARDSDSGKPVSIFLGSLESDGVDRQALHDLGPRLKALHHPNIAVVTEFAVSQDGEVRLVTGGPSGTPLSTYLAESRPPLAEIRNFAVQLVSALAYLHSQLPSAPLHAEDITVIGGRLLLTGSNLVPIDRISWAGATSSPISSMLRRATGRSPDERSDVFAAGVMLYYMASGIAIGAEQSSWSPAAVAFEHFLQERIPPSAIRQSIPPDWDELILRSIAASPSDRYANLGALRRALGELTTTELSTEPATVTEVGQNAAPSQGDLDWLNNDVSDYDVPSQTGPSRWLVSGIGAGVIALLLVFGAVWFLLGRDQRVAAVPPGSAVAVVTGLHAANSANASGANVRVVWKPVAGVSRYRLRILQSAVHGKTQVVSLSPSYVMKNVRGRQTYSWSVSAFSHGAWGPFSRPQSFEVAAPSVATPSPSVPATGAKVRARIVRFCWTSIRDAERYVLRIGGHTRRAASTCQNVALRPGSYKWAVAAQVKGVALYTGAYSQARRLTLLATRNTKPRHHNVTRQTTHPSTPAAPAPTSAPVVAAPPAVSAPVPTVILAAPAPTAVIIQQAPIQAPVQVQPVAPAPTAPAVSAAPTSSSPSNTTPSSGSKTACIPFVNC